MRKAKFIGRYQYRRFNETVVELEYEYRGHRYTVTENPNKGNEPLSWQHRAEQAEIDRLIETKEREKQDKNGPSVSECIDAFLRYCDTDDTAFWDDNQTS